VKVIVRNIRDIKIFKTRIIEPVDIISKNS
jgi:hypothetical protein